MTQLQAFAGVASGRFQDLSDQAMKQLKIRVLNATRRPLIEPGAISKIFGAPDVSAAGL